MKSFDIDKYNSRECQVHNHGFYLGQQSKQAEVDELRKRIDEALSCAGKCTWNIALVELKKILKGGSHES